MPKVIQAGEKLKPRRASAKSGTAYPYYDLSDSVEVADAVHNKAGGHATKDQLAHLLGYSTVKSGAYLTRISAAKMFGFIDIQKNDIYVTERGETILSPVLPEDESNAKVAAFLDVPLFSAVYEKFVGRQLPEPVGLKNFLKSQLNVVPDRVTPALRVLMNSAEQAGFFDLSGDRTKLIKPMEKKSTRETPKEETNTEPETPAPPKRYGGGDEPPSGIHTAISGLLRELPKPGSPWSVANKKRFMGAFQATIDFIYPEEEEADDG